MTDIPHLARKVGAIKALMDKIREVDAQTRAELLAAMRAAGAERVGVTLPDGTRVGSITLNGAGGQRARVVDETAFVRHVTATRPDEIEQQVRPAYRKKLLDEAAATGEDIPGVDIVDTVPYVANSFTGDGRAAVETALAGGQIQLRDVFALNP